MSGEFITLEGIEGVGKTTAVETVATIMRRLGRRVVVTREPGGTPLGENLRALLLAPASSPMAPTAELLLMFAARAQHLADVIEPALHAGSCVVCDRFTDATFAYQGGGRGADIDLIQALAELVQGELQPDLTLVLDIDPEVGLSRVQKRGERDRFETEELAFYDRVRRDYHRQIASQPARFKLIDASQGEQQVAVDIKSALDKFYSGFVA